MAGGQFLERNQDNQEREGAGGRTAQEEQPPGQSRALPAPPALPAPRSNLGGSLLRAVPGPTLLKGLWRDENDLTRH